MPCLLVVIGPPTPPCRSLRMRVNSASSAARSLANRNMAAASALKTRKWSDTVHGDQPQDVAVAQRLAPQRQHDLVPGRRVLPGGMLRRGERAARSRSAGTGTSAGRPSPGRTARPRDAARPRPCPGSRGRAARSRSARSAASGGSGAASRSPAPPRAAKAEYWRSSGPITPLRRSLAGEVDGRSPLAGGPHLHDENMTGLAQESPGETPGPGLAASDAAFRCELFELDWVLERI